MALEVHRSFLPEDMIRNFPRPNATVFVKITSPTAVRGEHLKADEIIEVTWDDASAIVAADRGVIVEKPADEPDSADETQPAPDKKGKGKKDKDPE